MARPSDAYASMETLERVFVATWAATAASPNRLRASIQAVLREACIKVVGETTVLREARRVVRSNAGLPNKRFAQPFVAAVAAAHGIMASKITFRTRCAAPSLARAEVIWLLRTFTDLSFPAIGNVLGGRDHSTIISAYRRVARAVAADEVAEARLRKLGRDVVEKSSPRARARAA